MDTRAPGGRITGLDGLRGVAALVVVIHHVLLVSPVFADVTVLRARAEPGTLHWWLSYTPMHVIWGGTEAVFVFFVLSGFVLTGPALRANASWLVYYPKRLLRLYLPVWASIVLAALSAILVVRGNVPGASWWVQAHGPLNVPSALRTAMLVNSDNWLNVPQTDWLNSPLWSLTWEVWFSLLLPLYIWLGVWAARRLWRTWALAVVLAAVMTVAFREQYAPLSYLPMFMFGVLLYLHRERIARAAAWIADGRRWVWPALLVVALVSITSYWMLVGLVPDAPRMVVAAFRPLQVAGACLFVVCAFAWPAAERVFDSRPLRWLGLRSFSLYLTHEIVLITAVLLLGGSPPLALALAIVLPVALVVASLFFRFVERPSHRFAQWVGGVVQAAVDRRRGELSTVSRN